MYECINSRKVEYSQGRSIHNCPETRGEHETRGGHRLHMHSNVFTLNIHSTHKNTILN